MAPQLVVIVAFAVAVAVVVAVAVAGSERRRVGKGRLSWIRAAEGWRGAQPPGLSGGEAPPRGERRDS